jgi:hypothetical protein
MKRIVGNRHHIGDGCRLICNTDPGSTTLSDPARLSSPATPARSSSPATRRLCPIHSTERKTGRRTQDQRSAKVAEDAASGEDMQMDSTSQFLCVVTAATKTLKDVPPSLPDCTLGPCGGCRAGGGKTVVRCI